MRDFFAVFRQGLRKPAMSRGRTSRSNIAGRRINMTGCRVLVADLVRRRVSVIVGDGRAALAAKAATSTIPIVFATGRPSQGWPRRQPQPAGRQRDRCELHPHELRRSSLGSCMSCVPGAARIAVLVDAKWPLTEPFVSQVRAAASAMGQQIDVVYVSSDREIESASTTLIQSGALHVGVGVFLVSQRERIVALAARHEFRRSITRASGSLPAA